jgi:hypothetical protein
LWPVSRPCHAMFHVEHCATSCDRALLLFVLVRQTLWCAEQVRSVCSPLAPREESLKRNRQGAGIRSQVGVQASACGQPSAASRRHQPRMTRIARISVFVRFGAIRSRMQGTGNWPISISPTLPLSHSPPAISIIFEFWSRRRKTGGGAPKIGDFCRVPRADRPRFRVVFQPAGGQNSAN